MLKNWPCSTSSPWAQLNTVLSLRVSNLAITATVTLILGAVEINLTGTGVRCRSSSKAARYRPRWIRGWRGLASRRHQHEPLSSSGAAPCVKVVMLKGALRACHPDPAKTQQLPH